MFCLAFLTTISLAGLAFGYAIFGRRTPLALFGSAPFLGSSLFVLLFHFFGQSGPWLVAGELAGGTAFVLLVTLFVRRAFCLESLSERCTRTMPRQNVWPDYISVGIVALFFLLQLPTFVGHDELNHFYLASQIKQGEYPPVIHGFPSLPAKYHYGWSILLGSLSHVSGFDFPLCSDLLTMYALSGALLLALDLARALGLSSNGRLFAVVGLFLGSGVFGPFSLAMLGSWSSGLSLTSLYSQHAWTFSTSLLLLMACILAHLRVERPSNAILVLILMIMPSAGVGLYAATMAPVVILFGAVVLASTTVFDRCHSRSIKYTASGLLLAGLWCAALMALWHSIGGMFSSGEGYGDVHLAFTLKALGLRDYIRYEGAYVLMAPLGFATWGYCVYRLLREGTKWFSSLPSYMFLVACNVLLVPTPLVVLITNSAYWDNFCKFNFVGILASWFILPVCLEQGLVSPWPISRWHFVSRRTILTVILIVAFLSCTVEVLTSITKWWDYTLDGTPMSRSVCLRRQRELSSLITVLHGKVDKEDRVLALSDTAPPFYPIDRSTNKPDVNLYKYVATHFPVAMIAAKYTGRSIVNFYDYNFMYDETLEYRLHDGIKAALEGQFAAIRRIHAEFVLIELQRMPTFVVVWEMNGQLIRVAENQKEGWVLFEVNSGRDVKR